MSSTKTVTVNAEELRDAFDFVSIGDALDHGAWICLDTGRIRRWPSEAGAVEEEIPQGVGDPDRYLRVPSRRSLDIGRSLALAFAARELPDDIEKVAALFPRRGAWAHFKDLMQKEGLLKAWFEFQDRVTAEVLLAWCAGHGIRLVEHCPY